MNTKVLWLLCFCAFASAYDDVDNAFNYKTIIRNNDELKQYIDCFNDVAPCNDFTAVIKKHLLDTVQSACKNCDLAQKHGYHMFLLELRKNFPAEYNAYKAKYDPDGKHFGPLEKELDKY